jgi:hypothetical protein
MEYDSRVDTYEHIAKVRGYLHAAIGELLWRAHVHDESKLSGIEKEAFDIATPRLAHTEYGSDEYRATLREIKPAVNEHYHKNSHHPEHYGNGIAGMHLLDLVEMLCDWKAAGERHDPPNNIMESIEYNIKRWGIEPQLASILRNTAEDWWDRGS